jgi:chorismate mutase
MMRWRDHTKATITSNSSVVSMIVSIAILGFAVMSGTSHAFASSSISGATNNSISKGPWNSKLQSSASSSIETAATVNGETGDNVKTSEVLSLDSIRASLIRQEETIIFALIERAQFRQNNVVYEPGASTLEAGLNSDDESFLEHMLTETEKLHSGLRRYKSPEEHAFYPEKIVANCQFLKQDLEYDSGLLSDVGDASKVNFNEILLKKYIHDVVPSICAKGDDEQHGSSVLNDIAVLQALSKRVHYGKFVAESKYLGDPEGYQALVEANDAEGVMKLLTNEAVELKVLRRARLKAATYGSEPLLADLPALYGESKSTSTIVAAAAASAVVAALEALGDDNESANKVCPSTVEAIYRDLIIPLTKDVEVAYLFRRCGKEPPPEFAPHRMSTDPE